MRKHRPAAAARAVTHVSGNAVRPRTACAGSTWLLLGVVLAGLFAMHGLGTHGTHVVHATEAMTMPMSAGMTAAMTAPSAAGAARDEDVTGSHSPGGSAAGAGMAGSVSPVVEALAGGAAETSTGATSQLVEDDGPTGLPGVAGLWGLCFAVLAAVVAWILTRGRALRVLALVRRAREVVAVRGPGRERDPPSLLVLSVHRC